MKTVIVISGVPGSGKTTLAKKRYRSLPHIDIADVYQDIPNADWYQAAVGVATKASKALKHEDTVIVEGYFMPGSQSLRVLRDNLPSHVQFRQHVLHQPKVTCRKRIMESGTNVEKRLYVLENVWDKAEEIMHALRRKHGTDQ